jgi:hypothetical protein
LIQREEVIGIDTGTRVLRHQMLEKPVMNARTEPLIFFHLFVSGIEERFRGNLAASGGEDVSDERMAERTWINGCSPASF